MISGHGGMVLVTSTDRVERLFRMRTRGYNYRAWQIVEAPVGSLVDDNHADYYKETLQTLCPCGTAIQVPQKDLRAGIVRRCNDCINFRLERMKQSQMEAIMI